MAGAEAASTVTAERLFPLLVQRVLEGGAFVSAKIERNALPPLSIPGLVARESLSDGEEILCIPRNLQLTRPLVQELGAELIPAVQALSNEQVRIEGPEVVAFVTKRLHVLEDLPASSWNDATWLDLMFGMQLSCDFSYMPHRQITDDSYAKQGLLPSPEVHNATWNEAAYCDAHSAITEAVPSELLGPTFELRHFRRSHLLLLTRTFARPISEQQGIELCCVPVADMFNHSCEPNATYEFDASSGDFSVSVNRDVAAGEELFITYGSKKSNVRLFRSYGFTMLPAVEPTWSIRIWPALAREVYDRFLPEGQHRKVLELEARRVDETARLVLQACGEHGTDPSVFLRAVCNHFLDKYEADSALEPALAELRRGRSEFPRRALWWRSEETLVEAFHTSLSSSSSSSGMRQFAVNALRVKMSEYLCLLTHIEALDILSGASQVSQCLETSADLSELLRQALESSSCTRPANAESGRNDCGPGADVRSVLAPGMPMPT